MIELSCIWIYGCATRGTKRPWVDGSFTSADKLQQRNSWWLLNIAQVSEYKEAIRRRARLVRRSLGEDGRRGSQKACPAKAVK
jgi:hypothetical protein